MRVLLVWPIQTAVSWVKEGCIWRRLVHLECHVAARPNHKHVSLKLDFSAMKKNKPVQ